MLILMVLAAAGCAGGSSTSNSARERKKAIAATAATEHGIDMFSPAIPRGLDGQKAIIHVGSVAITAGEFAHWDEVLTPKISSIEPKSRADCSSLRARFEVKLSAKQKAEKLSNAKLRALCIHQKQAEVKESALRQLISNQWVIGEAGELGVGVSEAEAQKQMEKAAIRQFKSKAAFLRYLKGAGRTVTDARLGVRLSMINERIHELIEHKAEAKINQEAIARYYRGHEKSFSAAKRSNAAAAGHKKTFREVEGLVRQKLSEELNQRELASFVRAFREKWLSRTTCSPGFVVSRCREWRGPSVLLEDAYTVN